MLSLIRVECRAPPIKHKIRVYRARTSPQIPIPKTQQDASPNHHLDEVQIKHKRFVSSIFFPPECFAELLDLPRFCTFLFLYQHHPTLGKLSPCCRELCTAWCVDYNKYMKASFLSSCALTEFIWWNPWSMATHKLWFLNIAPASHGCRNRCTRTNIWIAEHRHSNSLRKPLLVYALFPQHLFRSQSYQCVLCLAELCANFVLSSPPMLDERSHQTDHSLAVP